MWQHYANAHQSRNTQLNNDHTSLRNKHATKQLNDHTSLRGIHNSSSVHALSTSKNKTKQKKKRRRPQQPTAAATAAARQAAPPAGGATTGHAGRRRRSAYSLPSHPGRAQQPPRQRHQQRLGRPVTGLMERMVWRGTYVAMATLRFESCLVRAYF